MKIQKFRRKPFTVEGVRVTKKNMEEVAKWCNGEVKKNPKGVKHIFVNVHRPMNEKQTMAFVGDWILFQNRGFKIYTQNAFSRNFELVEKGIGSEHADYELEEDTPLPIEEVTEQASPKLAVTPRHLEELLWHFKPEDGDPHRP